MFTKSTFAFFSLAAAAKAGDVQLVTFDGADGTGALTDWFALVDPVMGGVSTGTWTPSKTDSYGTLDGEVKNVPSLSAPGFVTAGGYASFPDASSAISGGLVLNVRSASANYTGYRVSFAAGAMSPSYSCAGGGSLPGSRGCFKADFSIPDEGKSDFVEVVVPFQAFTDKWDSATGAATKTCLEDTDVCPTAELLSGIQYIEVWAEGVNGVIQLDVAGVSARADDSADKRAITVALAAPAYSTGAGVSPVTDLTAGAYIGRWYQTYASASVKYTFQLGGNCVTADYGATSNDTVVSVKNTVRVFSSLGRGVTVTGYAVQSPDTQGDFQVVLGGADPEEASPFSKSNYVIIGLGPINSDGLYDWATVSDNDQKTLYVLCRDPEVFKSKYEGDVLATLAKQGFTSPLNKPLETNQEGCVY